MYEQRHDLEKDTQFSQEHSSLLHGPPTEVRLLIWTHVLDNQTIHTINKYRRLGHAICDAEYRREWETEGPGLRASLRMYTYGILPTTKNLADHNLCDLLVTCRQIYDEAISLLYTTNIFLFFDLRTIAVFQTSLIPTRWDAIRFIEIHAMVYREDDIRNAVEARSHLQLVAWPTDCSALGSMPNLRRLRIFIGNARYLDRGYLAGGRETDLAEVVQRFLGQMEISRSTEMSLTR